jgi:hypothetical protein
MTFTFIELLEDTAWEFEQELPKNWKNVVDASSDLPSTLAETREAVSVVLDHD